MKRLTSMREFLFWAFILLVLPGCNRVFGLHEVNPPDATTPDPGMNLVRGSEPRDGAIFCDIERPGGRRCATALDKTVGVPISEAAVALNTGRSSRIGLDYSADARARCGGEPEAVEFQGPFPEGIPVCVNCTEVIGPGKVYPTAKAACEAQCHDLFFGPTEPDGTTPPVNPPTPETIAFCSAAARVSTNALLNGCFAGSCDSVGTLRPFFLDPRRTQEPVVWTDFLPFDGVTTGGADGNDLTRIAATTGNFDAGAASTQWITHGDAWVEFSVRAGQTQVVGLSEVPLPCVLPCSDTNPSDTSINFGIMVVYDGSIFVTESAAGGLLPGPVGTSVEGERFRVRLRDNGDGTAAVRYTKVVGACTPGMACNETLLHASMGAARYPLRVDSSLFQQNATVTDARLVRIH